MCHMGVEQTPNKSQHTKLTLEKKILPPLLPEFKLATFQLQDWRSYQQAILASSMYIITFSQTNKRAKKESNKNKTQKMSPKLASCTSLSHNGQGKG